MGLLVWEKRIPVQNELVFFKNDPEIAGKVS
jgi:hypothetical protein